VRISPVQLVGRLIVAEPIAAIVREPQLAGLGMEVEPDGIAHTAGDDLRPPTGEVDPGDRRVQRPRRLADIARRADRHVEPAVRAEGDELPAVVLVGREGVAQDLGLRRPREVAGDVAESQDAAHLGDVQGAVAEGEPARQVEPARQHVDLIRAVIAVPVDHRVHLPSAREPTNTTPGGPRAIWRALGTSGA
jgi:hypothetical protein